jgi:hypothetical protein
VALKGTLLMTVFKDLINAFALVTLLRVSSVHVQQGALPLLCAI